MTEKRANTASYLYVNHKFWIELRNYFIFIYLILISSSIGHAQTGTSKNDINKLRSAPNFWGVQIEGTTLLYVMELGGLIDYDLFSSKNKKYHIGTRFSIEYYDYVSMDVGGKSAAGPFTDINLYARHSVRGRKIWVSSMLGFSLHNKLEDNSKESSVLIRGGIELKYNLISERFGLLFKLASSFREETTFVGVGVCLGLYSR